MLYNIYIKTQDTTKSLLGKTEDSTRKVTEALKEKKEFAFIEGAKVYISKLLDFQIFSLEHESIKTGDELYSICQRNNQLKSSYFSNPYVPKNILEKVGKRVTDSFITDQELENHQTDVNAERYVDAERIKELESLKSNHFDFTRLIAVTKEINIANDNNLKFSIPPLVRSIIDQVPPIFGKITFAEVSGNYGSKSFRGSMSILDNSSRKIADSYLHTHIRKHEGSLPTFTQINFKNDLDVLLQEIIRIVKSE